MTPCHRFQVYNSYQIGQCINYNRKKFPLLVARNINTYYNFIALSDNAHAHLMDFHKRNLMQNINQSERKYSTM